ncbi:MAG: YqeG family HAD IIIA-type phosphatase [Oscillospiraceae bacterium]|nr:YqeG family HAD IIIA-type phosphatase [Oscillospiraceae bacterium]
MFKVDIALSSVKSITPELLKKYNISGLLLDLDNTLTTHDNPTPGEGIIEWIASMKASGIKMIIVSNNYYERVKPFADNLGLDFVPRGAKPLSKGFIEAKKRMDIPFENLAVVGDQIFTDVLGANMKRLKCIYVFPIEHEKKGFLRFKRRIEVPFLPKKLYDAKSDEKV